MNNLVKLLVVASLAIGVFGGGGFVAYRLFFKKPDPRGRNPNEPVVTPTPDPGIAMFNQAKLIFKANGLDSLTIQPGRKLIIPKGQFSLVVNTKKGDVTLMNNGIFFRWYKPL